MKIAITGASGHLGTNIIRALNHRGIRPRALIHQHSNLNEHADVECLRGNVLEIESLKECFNDIDIVYHLAAKISLATQDNEDIQKINVEGTRNVVSACLDRKVKRLVEISSIHAIKPKSFHQVIDENCEIFPKNEGYPYERSKANAHREVELGLQRGLNAITIFPTGLIGPYDYQISLMGKFFLDLYHESIPMIVKGGFNFADIRDVANGILTASECGKKGDRYLLGGHYASMREIVNHVHEITGKKPPHLEIPIYLIKLLKPFILTYAFFTGKGEIYHSLSSAGFDALKHYRYIDFSKSNKELKYNPRPLHETINDIYEWFEKAGYLNQFSFKGR